MKYLIQILLPLFLAFLVSSLILFFINPEISALEYYSYIFNRTLTNSMRFQAVLLKMSPLLCISAGLMLAFKAGLWNLGIDGQFFLGAIFCSALAPNIVSFFNFEMGGGEFLFLVSSCFLLSFLIGIIWAIIPAFLHIKYKINEVITSLMMSFIGMNLGNILIKSAFRDDSVPHPQTFILSVENRLPYLFESRVLIGFLIAIFLVLAVHYFLKNTPTGIKLRIIGVNRKTAIHAGYSVNILLFFTFLCSAGFIALAGAIEVLGVQGLVQANWNPHYSMLAIPLIFLSRCNGFLVIFFAFFFSVLLVGGESAARILQIPSYMTSVILALIMLFSGFTDILIKKR